MKVGFSGLGKMGKPIALNLAKAGVDLLVHGIDEKSFEEFGSKGIGATLDRSELAQCQVIFLCLPNTDVVKNVLFDNQGLFSMLEHGQILCDLSTIDYMATLEIADRLTSRGIKFMDSPVSGMEAKAMDGTLTLMCGGEQDTYEELLPLFQHIGSNICHMGPHGSGQLSKAINNTLFDINIAAFAEILPLAVKLGLDVEKIGHVINSSSGRSFASEFFIPRILKRNFSDGYPLADAYKDLISCAGISTRLGLPLPVMHAAMTTYQMALLQGLGDYDKGAMTCVFEKLMAVECKA